MDLNQQIAAFLEGAPHAVVGASSDRKKYGNKVLRAYLQQDRPVCAVNPKGSPIEGVDVYTSLADMPTSPYGVSIITPPAVTTQIANQIVQLGIKHVWMQPGSESDEAIATLQTHGANLIANGPCLLVALRFREAPPN